MQGSAVRRPLGCVKSLWPRGGEFTQPRAHLLAVPCTYEPSFIFKFRYISSVRKVIAAVWGLIVYAGIVLGDNIPLYGEIVSHEGVHPLVNLQNFQYIQ